MKLAFVVQRYGREITGGSETLARELAVRFAKTDEVTVLTSCARDYVTWRNDLPAGESVVDGVRVRRFPATEERDLDAFNRFSDELYAKTGRTVDEERRWLERQGPLVPDLVAHIAAHRTDYDAFVFFTYLYYPTYWGLREAGDRAVLVPTTHDEPPLRFSIYEDVFAQPRAFGFLSRAEERLVRERFPIGDRPGLVAGMGVEAPRAHDAAAARARLRIERTYALYAGRIDAGKGCAEMVAFYEAYRRTAAAPLDLLLIGTLAMPEPTVPGVRYLGFLSDDDKAAAVAGARVMVCPSPYESLSIALLEGLAVGVPALANARSPVLLDHCTRSNAGLYYENEAEFGAALDHLHRDERLRAAMAETGRAYIRDEYAWDAVMARYRTLIAAAAGGVSVS